MNAKLIRRTIEIDHKHGMHHLPSALSALPVIAGVYDKFHPGDVFVLSKGHAYAALGAVLESRGLRPDYTHSHPDRDPANGVTCTAGSLGHGLPMAVGIALGKKLAGEPGTVHVLVGDGEALEGTTWESLLMASAWKLDNLQVHVDGNGYGAIGKLTVPTDAVKRLANMLGVLLEWHKTERGWGVPSLKGTGDHVLALTDQQAEAMMEEVCPLRHDLGGSYYPASGREFGQDSNI